jgi:drug/metabolite transporter (DMT)-like permease
MAAAGDRSRIEKLVPAELLAFMAALFYSLSQLTAKMGTQTGSIMFGSLIGLVTGTTAVGVVTATTTSSWSMPAAALTLFAVAGIAGSLAGRSLAMRGVRDIGASVSVPVQASVSPIIATAAGALIFGEVISGNRVLSLAVILLGMWLCMRSGSSNTVLEVAGPRRRVGWSRLLTGLLWPASAAAAFAMSDILRKSGLAVLPSPMLAALIGLASALVVSLAWFFLGPSAREPLQWTPSTVWFGVSGLLSASAQVSLLFALRVGELSVVAPIVACQPVLIMVLGPLILRGVERFTRLTAAGGVLVATGIASLSL